MTEPSPRRSRPTIETVLLGASLGDVKEDVYRNTLAIAALIDVLARRGLVAKEELGTAMARLDREALSPLSDVRSSRPGRRTP